MNASAQPSSELFRRFHLLAYLLIFLAVAGFAYAEDSLTILIVTTVAEFIAWMLVEGPRGKPLPRLVVNAGVLGTAAMLFYDVVFTTPVDGPSPNLLLALGNFMTGILICKLFERKGDRDYAQIFTLTLLIMVAGAIFSASLMFAIILVCYLAVAMYAILLFHLRSETEGALLTHLAPAETLLPASGGLRLRRDLRRTAASTGFFILLITAGIFMITPRTRGQGFLTAWSAGATFRTGFSDHVQFSDYGHLQQSDAVVMEVKITQDGNNIGSEFYQPYFRGLTLDTYDLHERRWTRGAPLVDNPQGDHELAAMEPTPLVGEDAYTNIGMVTQEYTLHSYSNNVLFTVSPPVAIETDKPMAIHFSARNRDISVQGSTPQPLRYTIESALLLKADPDEPLQVQLGDLGDTGMPVWNGFFGRRIEFQRNLVPPQIETLARSLVKDIAPAGKPVPVERLGLAAERFEQYLRENYPYSLAFEAKDRALDPTADFLLNRKDTGGHCEYFASAMVMLCRAVGVNARMVTGFHGGDFNSLGGYYVVRQKNAHAWAEVFLPNRGWVTFDPSPISTDFSASSFEMTHWLRDATEILQRNWLSKVVSFDTTSQAELLRAAGYFIHAIPRAIQRSLNEAVEAFKDLFISDTAGNSARIAGLLSLLVIAGLSGWLVYHLHWRRTSQLAHILEKVDRRIQRKLAQELLFFDDFLRLLARTGLRKRNEQTPREYVEQLSPRLRSAAPEARWLVTTFYEIRFGAAHLTAEMRGKIAAAIHRVRDEVQHPS